MATIQSKLSDMLTDRLIMDGDIKYSKSLEFLESGTIKIGDFECDTIILKLMLKEFAETARQKYPEEFI